MGGSGHVKVLLHFDKDRSLSRVEVVGPPDFVARVLREMQVKLPPPPPPAAREEPRPQHAEPPPPPAPRPAPRRPAQPRPTPLANLPSFVEGNPWLEILSRARGEPHPS